MTRRADNNGSNANLTPDTVCELLTMLTNTENVLSDLLANVFNAAMPRERDHHRHGEPRERTDKRNGYANAFKHRTLKTRLGTIQLSVPQVRGSDMPLRPVTLDAAMASDKALAIALTELILEGFAPGSA